MSEARNRDVVVGEEIGWLTPIEILPKKNGHIRVKCLCRCKQECKRDISALRAALSGSKKPACKKCNRKAVHRSTFGDSIRLVHKTDPEGPHAYKESRIN